MVNRPASLDTLVATNLHADILSDLAAALAGSLGIAPTGNIDPGTPLPQHVRAHPRIGLRHHGQGPGQPGWHLLELRDAARAHRRAARRARRLMQAIEAVTADPQLHTRDLGGNATTAEVTDACVPPDCRRSNLRVACCVIDTEPKETTDETYQHGLASSPSRRPPRGAWPRPAPTRISMYWQAFPPGGESDLSARHQQVVLKKNCPAIDTIIQYRAGAGGALLWTQMNTLPGDGAQRRRRQPPAHRFPADRRRSPVQDRRRDARVLVSFHA